MYQQELAFIREITKTIYLEMINNPFEIMAKGNFDTVTNVDYQVEKALIEAILERFPGDTIISEEFNPNGKLNGRTWVIDPIDGTVNFARGSVYFGIQIALFNHEEVVLSYLYFPRLNDEYYAIINEGAYYNDRRVFVSKRELTQTIMSFSDFFVWDYDSNEFSEKIFFGLKDKLFRTRIMGSSAIDFALIASGVHDATFLRTTNLWDLAPGYLLTKEAGCIHLNEKLEPYQFGDYAIFVLTNPDFAEVIREIL